MPKLIYTKVNGVIYVDMPALVPEIKSFYKHTFVGLYGCEHPIF